MLEALGRLDEARERHEASLTMDQHLHGGNDHPDVAASLYNLGALLFEHGSKLGPRCALCRVKKEGLLKCTGCHQAHYCDKEHQKEHRKAHKRHCK